jgi:plastocyanin
MQRFRFASVAAGTGLALLLAIEAAHAQEPLRVEVTIKDHRFSPAEIHLPAGKRAIIDLHNADPMAEEFDSAALAIEKVIAGGRSTSVRLRPLEPGRYPFMGEYHAATAQGVIIVE